uniref:Uncharacterized protein n=1 Tax=Desulfovibrio sp. U5L TaxID=596152 RepID=I2Q6H1_9BACT
MKTKLFCSSLLALALLAPLPCRADDNVKHSQCLNTFKEKDGIQTGTIINLATGEVFETMGSAFSFDKNLVSPMCTIIKDRRFYYILISGVGRKIMVKKVS